MGSWRGARAAAGWCGSAGGGTSAYATRSARRATSRRGIGRIRSSFVTIADAPGMPRLREVHGVRDLPAGVRSRSRARFTPCCVAPASTMKRYRRRPPGRLHRAHRQPGADRRSRRGLGVSGESFPRTWPATPQRCGGRSTRPRQPGIHAATGCMAWRASGRQRGSPPARATSRRAEAARGAGGNGWATTAIPPCSWTAATASQATARPALEAFLRTSRLGTSQNRVRPDQVTLPHWAQHPSPTSGLVAHSEGDQHEAEDAPGTKAATPRRDDQACVPPIRTPLRANLPGRSRARSGSRMARWRSMARPRATTALAPICSILG